MSNSSTNAVIDLCDSDDEDDVVVERTEEVRDKTKEVVVIELDEDEASSASFVPKYAKKKRRQATRVEEDEIRAIEETSQPKKRKKAMSTADKRLSRELQKMKEHPPPGIKLLESLSTDRCWTLRIRGSEDSLYAGKTYRLRFRFSDKYPIEAPEVVFVGKSPPLHEHIYSNGHICLSILYDEWSPALSVTSVCLSIISMMSSCTKEGYRRPGNDASYVRMSKGKSPTEMQWSYHDDKC